MKSRRLAVLLVPSVMVIAACGGDKESASCPDWNTDTFNREYHFWLYRQSKACTRSPESPREAADAEDYHETNCTDDGARLFFNDEDCMIDACMSARRERAKAAEAGGDLACEPPGTSRPDECDAVFDAFYRACPADPAM